MSFVIEMVETQEQPTLILKMVTQVSELPKILGKAFMDIVTHIMEALENCATGEVDNIAMYNIEAGLKEANRKLLEEIGIEEEAHAK